MLKYFIQVIEKTFAEGILCVLIFALFPAEKGQKKRFLAGCGAGAALVLAFLKYTTTLINRELWNTGILCAALAAGLVLAVLLWRIPPGKNGTSGSVSPGLPGPAAPSSVPGIFGAILAGLLLFYVLPDIFLYPSEFVMMGESVFSTNFLIKALGYLGGMVLVFVCCFALFRAGRELPFGAVRAVFSSGLVLIMVRQAAAVIQVLYARRLIPRSKLLFAFLKETVNRNSLFLFALMALTMILPVMLWIRSMSPPGPCTNPAEGRKRKAAARRQRRGAAGIAAAYALGIVSLTALRSYDRREAVLSPAEPMEIAGEEIIIPFAVIEDGHLHRFMYTASNGTEVRFIVIRKNESAWGVGLDACDICGPTGYYERKNEVICKLCDVVMNKTTIGFKGGCNPVPLAYRVRSGAMVIQLEDLENEKGRFK